MKRVLQNSFAAGEIAPSLLGRTDIKNYQAGASKLKNFVVLPQGAIRQRAGFQYIGSAINSASPVRLIPFRFSSSQTFVLEFGSHTMRILTRGAYILKSGTLEPYQISTPYAGEDLFDLDYSQNADIVTLTSQKYAPRELRRYGNNDWRIVDVSMVPTLPPPSTIVVQGVFANNLNESEEKDKYKLNVTYKVTSVDANGVESVGSAPASGTGNYYINGCSIRVSWSAVKGADHYRLYRSVSGVFGYVGQTDGLHIDDIGDNPRATDTPPKYSTPFSGIEGGGQIKAISILNGGAGYYKGTIEQEDPDTGEKKDVYDTTPWTTTAKITDSTGSGANITFDIVGGVITAAHIISGGSNYTAPTISVNSELGTGAVFSVSIADSTIANFPSASTQFDQRRVFAGSSQNPLKVWMTNAGEQDLMIHHLPVMDDDRITFTAVAADADRIKHAVALNSLILFTGSSELRVFTQNSDALTPSSIAVRAQSYIGANDVQPVTVNNQVIYAAARGGHVHGLGYDYNSAGYLSSDLSVMSVHLFDNLEIKDLTLSKAPVQVVWAVSSNGKLLGMTYLPEQNIIAWHQHDVGGNVESVCSVSEGMEDHVYIVVNRDGLRCIERMNDLNVPSSAVNYRYLDSYLNGTFVQPQTSVSGLSHLKGKEVAVFVDGVQQHNKVVNNNGAIALDAAGRNITVGLPMECDFISVPLSAGANGDTQGYIKNVGELYLRVSYSGNVKANNYPNDHLWDCENDDIYMLPSDMESHLVKLSLSGEWSYQGQIQVKHTDAFPLEISAITANVEYQLS